MPVPGPGLAGRARARHPWRTLAAWTLAIVAITMLSTTAGGEPVDDFHLPDEAGYITGQVIGVNGGRNT